MDTPMTYWLLTLVSYAKFENHYKDEIRIMMEITLFSLLHVITTLHHAFLMSYVFILFFHHYLKIVISISSFRYFYFIFFFFLIFLKSSLPWSFYTSAILNSVSCFLRLCIKYIPFMSHLCLGIFIVCCGLDRYLSSLKLQHCTIFIGFQIRMVLYYFGTISFVHLFFPQIDFNASNRKYCHIFFLHVSKPRVPF